MSERRTRLMYEVSRLHRRGESMRAIARTLRINRRTVTRLLREVEERRATGDDAIARLEPQRRAPRPSKLDVYADFIAELIGRYPNIRATRLHEELCGQGFNGGYTIVREYLNDVRPKKTKKPAQLVRTGPGKQAQADWSPYALADGTPLYCFSCVLSYSRYLYAYFCTDMRQTTVFRQLRAAFDAFDAFGGVPDEIVFDSMPGIVDRWELDTPVLNLHAVDFAVYYDTGLHIAPRGDGPYKGKIERPFRYIEESLLNARTFHTVQQARDTMAWWLAHKANPRKHSRLGRRPVDMLEEERPHLKAAPSRPYDDRDLAYRVVDSYGYVDFDGNHYRAPVEVGSWVYVRASETEVDIVAGAAKVVDRHPRRPRGAGEYTPPPKKNPRRTPVRELLPRFDAWGTTAVRYAEMVCRRQRYAGAELAHILAQQKTYSAEDILAAIEHAARFGAYGAKHIERILEVNATPRTLADRLAGQVREHIQSAMAQAPVQQRALGEYARLLAEPATDGAHCEEDSGQEEEPQQEDDQEDESP